MELGLVLGNLNLPTGREAIEAAAREADQIGFDSLWMADHTAIPIRPDWQEGDRYTWDLYDPFVTAGYVAAVTKRAKLAFGVIVLPYRNPVITAKMVASLDQLSQGRVILGVGPGYLPEEFRALGIPLKNTGDRTNEYIDAFRALWSSERPVFEGKYIKVKDVFFRPRPVQEHLPIWIGGFSEAAMQRAVRQGDGWYVPRLSVEGLRPYVERVRAIAAEEGRDLTDFVFANRLTVRFADKPTYELPERVRRSVQRTVTPETLPIIGPPDHIAEQIMRFETELGVTHLAVGLHEADPLPEHLKALERFAGEVMPQLQGGVRASELSRA
jgi:probable F420-dependent oxidoreductase